MPRRVVKHVANCCAATHAVARLDELGVQFCELPVQRVAAQVQAANSKPQHCGRLHRRRGGHGQRKRLSGRFADASARHLSNVRLCVAR